MASITLMGNATVVGTNVQMPLIGTGLSSRTFQATLTGSGTVSTQVSISVSNDNVGWIPLVTFNLSGLNQVSDGQASYAPWQFLQLNVDALSGSGAAVTITLGL